ATVLIACWGCWHLFRAISLLSRRLADVGLPCGWSLLLPQRRSRLPRVSGAIYSVIWILCSRFCMYVRFRPDVCRIPHPPFLLGYVGFRTPLNLISEVGLKLALDDRLRVILEVLEVQRG